MGDLAVEVREFCVNCGQALSQRRRLSAEVKREGAAGEDARYANAAHSCLAEVMRQLAAVDTTSKSLKLPQRIKERLEEEFGHVVDDLIQTNTQAALSRSVRSLSLTPSDAARDEDTRAKRFIRATMESPAFGVFRSKLLSDVKTAVAVQTRSGFDHLSDPKKTSSSYDSISMMNESGRGGGASSAFYYDNESYYNQSMFMFIGRNYLPKAMSILESPSSDLSARREVLTNLGQVPCVDIGQNENWDEFKKLFSRLLFEEPELTNELLSFLLKMVNSRTPHLIADAYLLLLENLERLCVLSSHNREPCLQLSDGLFVSSLKRLALLREIQMALPNAWLRHPERVVGNLIHQSFKYLALSEPAAFKSGQISCCNPLLLYALIDPRAEWLQKWFHGSFCRSFLLGQRIEGQDGNVSAEVRKLVTILVELLEGEHQTLLSQLESGAGEEEKQEYEANEIPASKLQLNACIFAANALAVFLQSKPLVKAHFPLEIRSETNRAKEAVDALEVALMIVDLAAALCTSSSLQYVNLQDVAVLLEGLTDRHYADLEHGQNSAAFNFAKRILRALEILMNCRKLDTAALLCLATAFFNMADAINMRTASSANGFMLNLAEKLDGEVVDANLVRDVLIRAVWFEGGGGMKAREFESLFMVAKILPLDAELDVICSFLAQPERLVIMYESHYLKSEVSMAVHETLSHLDEHESYGRLLREIFSALSVHPSLFEFITRQSGAEELLRERLRLWENDELAEDCLAIWLTVLLHAIDTAQLHVAKSYLETLSLLLSPKTAEAEHSAATRETVWRCLGEFCINVRLCVFCAVQSGNLNVKDLALRSLRELHAHDGSLLVSPVAEAIAHVYHWQSFLGGPSERRDSAFSEADASEETFTIADVTELKKYFVAQPSCFKVQRSPLSPTPSAALLSSDSTSDDLIDSFLSALANKQRIAYDFYLSEALRRLEASSESILPDRVSSAQGLTETPSHVSVQWASLAVQYGRWLHLPSAQSEQRDLESQLTAIIAFAAECRKKQSFEERAQVCSLDWPTSIAFLIFGCDSNRAKQFISRLFAPNLNSSSVVQWLRGCNSDVYVHELIVELLSTLRRRHVMLYNVLQMRRVHLSQLLQKCLLQGFVNYLDFPDICSFVILSLLGGSKFQISFLMCLVKQLVESVLSAEDLSCESKDQRFSSRYDSPFKGFSFHSFVSFFRACMD